MTLFGSDFKINDRYGVQPHPEMSNPNDATFLVDVNSTWLRNELGELEYKKASMVPEDEGTNQTGAESSDGG